MSSIVVLSTAKTLKANTSKIPFPFQWCETLAEILDTIQGGKSEETTHLIILDKPAEFKFNDLLLMDNIVNIEICYRVPYPQRIKHDKIRYTSIDVCLSRWHYISHCSSRSYTQRFAESGEDYESKNQRGAHCDLKELMTVTDSN